MSEIITIESAFSSLSKALLIEPRSDAEMEKWIWKNETRPRLRECGFSERHAERITEWNCPSQEGVFRTCISLCRGAGAIVALVGVRGCGKTTICAQMALVAAENESLAPWDRVPPYRKLQDLVERYKPLYGNMGTFDPDALSSQRDWYCSRPQLAFIDETHECEDLQVKQRLLTDIIDRRYAAKRDTILVSNQTPEEFQRTIGDSILSRLSEHGQIIPCSWSSWRSKK
jgi:DNA replication protein DnaC